MKNAGAIPADGGFLDFVMNEHDLHNDLICGDQLFDEFRYLAIRFERKGMQEFYWYRPRGVPDMLFPEIHLSFSRPFEKGHHPITYDGVSV